jgi:hypothetical protein
VFDWLFEGRLSVYVFLAILAGLLLYLWWIRRKRWFLYASVGAAALAGVYLLLDRAVETDREQIQRKLTEMAAAVRDRAPDRLFAHISESFRLETLNRAGFREFVNRADRERWVTELRVWDFEFPADFKETGRVAFQAKPTGPMIGEGQFFRVEAVFRRDPDGQWRLQTFQLFDPLSDTNQPVRIPHLPQ